jgi:wyosine [tRNA(Phe)-imidazoG37] synthetase (radical SAM superfamily)
MHFPRPAPEYANLRVLSDEWGVVYQFKSRRFNNSLGINLLGHDKKVCSFNCPYCELGATELRMNDIKKSNFFADPQFLIEEITKSFDIAKNANIPVDAILFVGNGEPTLYPDLDIIVAKVVELRDQLYKGVPTGILTNGSHLDTRKTASAVSALDLRMVKFDAGNDKTLKRINAPLVKDTVEKLIGNARRIKDVIIQSCFVQGAADNTKPEDLDEWIEAIGMIKPEAVHLYTLDRVPASSGLLKTDEDTLYTISAKLEKRTRIKAKVFF